MLNLYFRSLKDFGSISLSIAQKTPEVQLLIDDIHQEFQSISIQWMLDDPFWGHLLSGIPKSTAPGPSAISWSVESGNPASLQLSIDPGRWAHLGSLEVKKAQLQQELLHLLFHHPFDTGHFHFPHLYDLACDWIIEKLKIIPHQPQIGFSPATFGIEVAGTSNEVAAYYQPLEQFWLEEVQAPRPHAALQKLKEYETSASRYPHKPWHQAIAKLSQGEKDIIQAGVDQLLISTLDRVGAPAIAHWPAALRLVLEARQPTARSTVDWRRVLRLFMVRHKRTYLKNTLRRPSKRYGTTPGIRIHQQQKLLVVLDTSASMQAAQFHSFFTEIHHLWRLGAAIHIVECDTQIRRDYPYLGQRPPYVEGRGGSSFDPPIQWANQIYHPDAVLYFTDGEAPKLQTASRYPLIWVLSQARANTWSQDQGLCIELPSALD